MAAMSDGKHSWTCPTDRELTLRAKLNAGWSVHSQDYFRKSEPILESELRCIENVIERAKEVDGVEKGRIRSMVCKLENLSRNSIGDGTKSCSMCGVPFGFFRTSSVKCSDCSMGVCEKCRIDIDNFFEESVLCKICSEYREVWKKSNGWFYGIFPQVEQLNCEDLKWTGASHTWAHRARDIVRLESFEAPEPNHSDQFLYKTWAVNSNPELNIVEDSDITKTNLENIQDRNTDRKYSAGRKIARNSMRHRRSWAYFSSEDSSIEEDNLYKQDTHNLKMPALHISKISVSCPVLQEIHKEEENIAVQKKTKKSSAKKKIMKPAIRLVEKIKSHKMFH